MRIARGPRPLGGRPEIHLGSGPRPDHGFEVGGALLLESRAAEECLADLRARGAPRKRTPRRRAEALAGRLDHELLVERTPREQRAVHLLEPWIVGEDLPL